MTINCRNAFPAFAILVGVVLFKAPSARADFQLEIQSNNGSNVVITDGGKGDTNPLTGAITYMGMFGGYELSLTTGVSKPLVGGANEAQVAISSIDVAFGGSGTLTIKLTDTGFNFPLSPGSSVQMVSAVTGSPSSGTSFSFQSYADASNTAFKTSGSSVSTTGVQGFFKSAVNANLATGTFTRPLANSPSGGAYSLTNVTTLKFGAGGGSVSLTGGTEILAAEPATMAMALSGLPVLALIRWRLRRRRS